MPFGGSTSLRNLFDGSPTPHIAHPPSTHHRDYYIASDGSHSANGSGLGVIIEGRNGNRVGRFAINDDAPDNNVAEYRALHFGLDILADRSPPNSSVGIIVDHDSLARNVNAVVLRNRHPDHEYLQEIQVPSSVGTHWRGIQARVSRFDEIRAARLDSRHNPAHPLANAPDQYAHVNQEPDRCLRPGLTTEEGDIPPPSRSNRHASD
ncbi:MAG: reverse transcriptase-like protein [Halobacteriaceae archaeon]